MPSPIPYDPSTFGTSANPPSLSDTQSTEPARATTTSHAYPPMQVDRVTSDPNEYHAPPPTSSSPRSMRAPVAGMQHAQFYPCAPHHVQQSLILPVWIPGPEGLQTWTFPPFLGSVPPGYCGPVIVPPMYYTGCPQFTPPPVHEVRQPHLVGAPTGNPMVDAMIEDASLLPGPLDMLRQQAIYMQPAPYSDTASSANRCHIVVETPEHGTIRRSLAHYKGDSKRMAVLANIRGTFVPGLIDTGADLSVISLDLARRLHLPIQPSSVKLSGPDGHALTCHGAATMSITSNGHTIPVTACVIDNLGDHLLLGHDFLSANKAQLDYATGLVTLCNDGMKIVMTPAPAQNIHKPINPSTARICEITAEAKSYSDKADRVKQMVMEQCTHVPHRQRQDIADVLALYADNIIYEVLPRIEEFFASINVKPGTRPVKHKERSYQPAVRNCIIDEVNKLLEQGFVEPGYGPWRARCVPVLKPDGTIRFCVDYRDLNNATVEDAFPAPNPEDIFDRLRGKKIFSSIDLKQGYYQVRLDERSRDLTGFGCPLGLFRWTVLPMGVKNACAIFQRLMQWVLKEHLGKICDVYLDDIIIYSDSMEEHLEHLKTIMDCISKANLGINFKKCQFAVTEIKFLGEIIDARGRRCDPEKTSAILNIETPTTKKAVRQFMGMANYHRHFIKDFAKIARPLNLLLHDDIKSVTEHWKEEQQQAFETLKASLTKAPVLAYPDFNRPFIIEVDASDYAIGAMLCQEHTTPSGRKVHRPVAYSSCTLNKAQQNYSATDKEGLGVMWACEKFHRYLTRDPVTIITDHRPLVTMQGAKQATKRVESWRAKLQIYKPIFIHRAGKDHVVADALSRLPTSSTEPPLQSDLDELTLHRISACENVDMPSDACIRKVAEEVSAAITTDIDGWRQAQREDALLGTVITALEAAKDKPHLLLTAGMEFVSNAHQHFSLRKDGMLMLITSAPSRDETTVEQVVAVPAKLVPTVLATTHSTPEIGAHLGVKKLFPVMRRKFWWPTMYRDLCEYIGGCLICQRHRIGSYKKSHLQPHIPSSRPMQVVSVDLIALPRSGQFDKALVAIDHFTRFVWAVPISDGTAHTVNQTIKQFITRLFKPPDTIIADNGPEFRNEIFTEECKASKIELIFTSSHHPQANPVERHNRTLISMLRATADSAQDWPQRIADVTLAFNTTAIHDTSVSPHDLMYAFRYENPLDKELAVVDPDTDTPSALADEHADNVEWVKQTRDARVTRGREAANASRKPPAVYKVGQLVWKRNLEQVDNRHYNRDDKLNALWIGPHIVTRAISSTTYSIRPIGGATQTNVHVDLLRPIHSADNKPIYTQQARIFLPSNCEPKMDKGPSRSKGISRRQRVARPAGQDWEVEKIIGHRFIDGALYLQIKWVGFVEPTWEPENYANAPNLTRDYFNSLISIRATADEGRGASAK